MGRGARGSETEFIRHEPLSPRTGPGALGAAVGVRAERGKSAHFQVPTNMATHTMTHTPRYAPGHAPHRPAPLLRPRASEAASHAW
jgi:hypothetical protein